MENWYHQQPEINGHLSNSRNFLNFFFNNIIVLTFKSAEFFEILNSFQVSAFTISLLHFFKVTTIFIVAAALQCNGTFNFLYSQTQIIYTSIVQLSPYCIRS